ncbi:CDP-diacylglycerol--serine O-phosphatidyltransferase [Candidatus Pelagisphaera phototrophica]|uniref:CDP-diacylglycerol--serine O-phosphatidyltransferase n=1 Tax=Candidatus Pelagisphaera phototrophica TaxID=2684113 RepID=UPI0024B7268F|nr:CDP-diacylglycerol--serine O-phosphatidyltransferase [Candidatus Pelagisphaera phototrophica]
MSSPHPKESGTSKIDSSQASRIYLLPNLFTAGNLFCGFMAIMKCIQARYNVMLDDPFENPAQLYAEAVLFILGGMLCDSLDGRVARLGGRESLFGKEFDSIVDMVSFGVAPALMVMFLILNPEESLFFRNIGWFLGFVYLLCAGVRLARFNVITHPLIYPANIDRTNSDFIGLPVPAAAGMIATLVLVINNHDLQRWAIALPILMVFISYLMISPIRYPSFKSVDWNTKVRLRTFILMLAIAAFVYLYKQYALALTFLGYLFYGVIRHLLMIQRIRRKERAK